MMGKVWAVIMAVGVCMLLAGCGGQSQAPTLAATLLPVTGDGSREINTVLAFGNTTFEPGVWLAGAQENFDRTVASWTYAEQGGFALAEYLHFDTGIEASTIATFFDTAWFDSAFADYDSWGQTNQCAAGQTTLYEFTLILAGVNYLVRYWVEPINASRVLASHILFPQDQQALLDAYATRYRPNLPKCA
jgi:hypothetical protein